MQSLKIKHGIQKKLILKEMFMKECKNDDEIYTLREIIKSTPSDLTNVFKKIDSMNLHIH